MASPVYLVRLLQLVEATAIESPEVTQEKSMLVLEVLVVVVVEEIPLKPHMMLLGELEIPLLHPQLKEPLEGMVMGITLLLTIKLVRVVEEQELLVLMLRPPRQQQAEQEKIMLWD